MIIQPHVKKRVALELHLNMDVNKNYIAFINMEYDSIFIISAQTRRENRQTILNPKTCMKRSFL